MNKHRDHGHGSENQSRIKKRVILRKALEYRFRSNQSILSHRGPGIEGGLVRNILSGNFRTQDIEIILGLLVWGGIEFLGTIPLIIFLIKKFLDNPLYIFESLLLSIFPFSRINFIIKLENF